MQKELIYFADPMCSWCWGFSPVIQSVSHTFADQVPLRVVLGGLFPGTSRNMNEQTKNEIREHWGHVNELSGQPFNYDFFDRTDFTYDTEPACRAVVTARHLQPSTTLSMLEHLHRSFYTQNLDITQTETLSEVASEVGLDPATFIEAFESQAIRDETVQDFQFSRSLGVNGFPTLVACEGEARAAVTVGYRPLGDIMPLLESWVEGRTRIAIRQQEQGA